MTSAPHTKPTQITGIREDFVSDKRAALESGEFLQDIVAVVSTPALRKILKLVGDQCGAEYRKELRRVWGKDEKLLSYYQTRRLYWLGILVVPADVDLTGPVAERVADAARRHGVVLARRDVLGLE